VASLPELFLTGFGHRHIVALRSAPEGDGIGDPRTFPAYAVFDDYRYNRHIAVVVRWLIVVTWLFLVNYRAEADGTLAALNGMGAVLVLANGYLCWRLLVGRPLTRR